MATQGLTQDEMKAVEAFRADVVEPSMDGLVILDFMADWCGPCKQLAPVLEKVAADYADKGVTLVKIDVDKNAFIASQFQVRSVPTVYAIHQGKPVADLGNARTEAQLAQTLDQIIAQLGITGGGSGAPDIGPALAEAEAQLAAGNGEAAYMGFAGVIQAVPDNVEALGGMVRALAALDRIEEAKQLLESLPADMTGEAPVERARAALAIAEDRPEPEQLAELRAEVESSPDDLQKRYNLAVAEIAAGNRDAAADGLLHIIAADRDWNEGEARAKLLSIFETIGLEDPWVSAQRRRLSAILFG